MKKYNIFRKWYIYILLLCFVSCSKEEEEIYNDPITYIESGNAIKIGVQLNINTPFSNKYYDDFIHPCVRYIKEGFAGHQWWLVATPYYNNNNKLENPILLCGDSNPDGTPPNKWTFVKLIEDTPSKGYNSDPCLFFNNGYLWIFWRENWTPFCTNNGSIRATVGVYTLDAKSFSEKRIFAKEISATIDSEMCPIVINHNGETKLYATYYQFEPERKNLGLAIWKLINKIETGVFSIEQRIQPLKTNIDFWHFDIFEFKNVYYCVYTSEEASQIILGRSTDGTNFKFFKTPLISEKISRKKYFYKPSAMVLNGEFYLWYPCMESGSVKTSKLWMSHAPFDQLIKALESKGMVE